MPDGGYTFSPEQLNAVIGKWAQLRQDLEDDRVLAVRAAGVPVAPADEVASMRIARGNDAAWEAFLEHNRAMSRFVEVYLAELTAARDTYLQREREASRDFIRR